MEPGDADELVEVSLAADTLFADAGLELPPDDPREMLGHVERVLVAVAEGRVRGLAATVTLDGTTHLEQLAVHPDHGRRGTGGALLEAVCADAADAGRDRVTLTTFRDLPWNGPWYERRGFAVLPRAEWAPTWPVSGRQRRLPGSWSVPGPRWSGRCRSADPGCRPAANLCLSAAFAPALTCGFVRVQEFGKMGAWSPLIPPIPQVPLRTSPSTARAGPWAATSS